MTTETTTETTPARFALNGDAPEWLARYMAGEEIPDTWSPSGDYDGATIGGMTYEAAGQGIITAPDGMTVEYEYTPDGDDGGGFRWLLYAGQSYRSLRIASPYQRAWRIGEYDAYGADAALLVLSNAVEWANNLLDDLAAYVASQPRDRVTEETVIVDAHLTEAQFRRVGELLNTPLGRHKPDSYRYVFEAESPGVADGVCEYLRLSGVPYERKTTTRWEP